ncbi:unnamed protein product [Eruca vesicaria subsp. sativa]|uniref:Uncharacterized protein n=1 Tax=Eruca vesicaria subsp. sativa TaxID=29727 RepID=A0ABC8K9T5_ERUVS|nr:unnamed protein product [Eruca vesicaria subsp. sativa]
MSGEQQTNKRRSPNERRITKLLEELRRHCMTTSKKVWVGKPKGKKTRKTSQVWENVWSWSNLCFDVQLLSSGAAFPMVQHGF